jgi:mono/diheme cytochrome c family protein
MQSRPILWPALAIGAAPLLVSLAAVGAPSTPAATVDKGWYTEAQAAQGHQLFNNLCAQCHRPDLTGALGPALRGQAFLQHWANQPLGDLFDFEHANMPAVNPGSVPDAQMWTITAYILQRNGFPAGQTVLGPDTGTQRVLAAK